MKELVRQWKKSGLKVGWRVKGLVEILLVVGLYLCFIEFSV
ncbi:MAG: hypothetical protein QGF23_01285 [Dehalococcoidales bacterium]|nr:hypothetical protein [Dehalococcoidales bacterium]